jgi:hypothetical protein
MLAKARREWDAYVSEVRAVAGTLLPEADRG